MGQKFLFPGTLTVKKAVEQPLCPKFDALAQAPVVKESQRLSIVLQLVVPTRSSHLFKNKPHQVRVWTSGHKAGPTDSSQLLVAQLLVLRERIRTDQGVALAAPLVRQTTGNGALAANHYYLGIFTLFTAATCLRTSTPSENNWQSGNWVDRSGWRRRRRD
jgi:hypothetical protein